MNDRRLSNDQVGQITKRANEIKWGEILDPFSTRILEDTAATCLINPMQLLIPLLPTVAHHLGPSTIQISMNYSEKPVIYAALLGNPSTGKTPALRLVTRACYEVEKALNISSDDSKLANGATVESTIQLLSEKSSVLSLYDEGSTFIGSIGRYNPNGVALERAVYLELYGCPEQYKRETKSSRVCALNPQLNICLMAHGYLFVDLIRGELTTLNDGLSHRFFIGAPPNDTSEVHSLSSTKTNSCAEVSLASMIYLTKRLCDTPVIFQLDPDAFTRFDEFHVAFRKITNLANTKNEFFPAAQFGKANTQLIRLSTVIHAICSSFNYLRTVSGADNPKITPEFISIISSKLSEWRKDFLIIRRESIDRGYTALTYFYKSKLVFANLNDFNSNESNIIDEMQRYLSRRDSVAINNQTIRVHHDFDEHQIKTLKKVLLVKTTQLTSVDCNTRFRMAKVSSIEMFKTFERLGFGKYFAENSSTHKVPTFKKLELYLVHDNYALSLTLSRFEISLKDFIDSYPYVGNTPSSNASSSSSSSSSSFESPLTLENPFPIPLRPRSDSVGGLNTSFNSNFSFGECSNINIDNERIEPGQRALKTKTTSFMVDQGREKTSKSNEEFIVDLTNDQLRRMNDDNIEDDYETDSYSAVKTKDFSCYTFLQKDAENHSFALPIEPKSSSLHVSSTVAPEPEIKYKRGPYKKKINTLNTIEMEVGSQVTSSQLETSQSTPVLKRRGRPSKKNPLQSTLTNVPQVEGTSSSFNSIELPNKNLVSHTPSVSDVVKRRGKSLQQNKCVTDSMKAKPRRSGSLPSTNNSRCKQNKTTIGFNLKFTSDQI